MKEITSNDELVACCGLYCGACDSFLSDRCPGCRKNENAAWCGVRRCCMENGRTSCAECLHHPDPKNCTHFHNFFSRMIGFFLRSDRAACIRQIKEKGVHGHAQEMTERKSRTIRKPLW